MPTRKHKRLLLPHQKITQTTISKISATGKVYFIRDSDLKGFAIKVTALGKASFIVEKRVKGGRNVRTMLGDIELMSLREAREVALQALAQIGSGVDINKVVAPQMLPHDALKKHLERYIDIKNAGDKGLAKGTVDGYRSVMNTLFKDWENHPAHVITSDMVILQRSELLKKGHSVSYVNRGFRTLKAILNLANLPQNNPVVVGHKQIRASLKSEAKKVYLDVSKIIALFEAYHDSCFNDLRHKPNIFAAALFSILTGCRKQDILQLEWETVNYTEGTIRFVDKKEGTQLLIPIVGMLADLLERLPRNGSNVFGFTYSTYRTQFDRHIKPLLDCTTQDFRSTFSEHANFAGFDEKQIGTALNHSHSRSTVTSQYYLQGELVKLKTLKPISAGVQAQYMEYILTGKLSDVRENNTGPELVRKHGKLFVLWRNYLSTLGSEATEKAKTQIKIIEKEIQELLGYEINFEEHWWEAESLKLNPVMQLILGVENDQTEKLAEFLIKNR